MRAVIALILLVGCAAPVPPDFSRSVTVVSGFELGNFTKTVYVDDRVDEKHFDRGPNSPSTHQVVAGAFDRAAAVIAAQGPAVLATVKAGPDTCPSYDLVRIEPPTADFDMIMAECPDPAVTALMQDVLAAMQPR